MRLRVVRCRCGNRGAHLQLRDLFGDLLTGLVGKRPLHHPTGFSVPVVPQVREGVGQALTLELTVADHPMQVLLALEEVQWLVDAVDTNIGAAIRLHAETTIVATRRFKAHHRLFVAGKTAVGQQEETFTGHRRVAARLNGVFGMSQRHQQRQQQRNS
ncbi:hypothetical protein D3C73_1215880 [compost metagenome]